jgi:hypothetical protein
MSWKEGGMRRTLGLVAVTFFLSACSTTVLETRSGMMYQRLGGGRTLVLADVRVPLRADTEDAIATRIPGAVAAHTLPGAPSSAALGSLSIADWDTVVFVTVAGADIRYTPGLGDGNFGIAGSSIVFLDLDVSVQRVADRRELYGLTVRRSEASSKPIWAVTDQTLRFVASSLAPEAAEGAAKRMRKAGLFD